MEGKYLISVKTSNTAKTEEDTGWRFASIDVGFYASKLPSWDCSEKKGKLFDSQEEAEDWFEQNKTFLLGRYYSVKEFELSTLAIRQVTYQEVRKLIV